MSANKESCNHNCASCGQACKSRTNPSQITFEKPNVLSNIKNVIAVVSGKGGVGKSLVTSLLAVTMQRKGFRTAILDADITGPSIPKAFGIQGAVEGSEMGILPKASRKGIELMSVNFMLDEETTPVVWRGPIISGVVKQFWTDVIWHDIDYMFIDMPPGTGDVPLTVFQSIPVKGVIIVTTPSELVGMIVEKAVNMARSMNIPILGLVENMSYYECPKCAGRIPVFGESRIEAVADRLGIPTYAKIPVNAKLAAATDKGMIELFDGNWLEELAEKLISL